MNTPVESPQPADRPTLAAIYHNAWQMNLALWRRRWWFWLSLWLLPVLFVWVLPLVRNTLPPEHFWLALGIYYWLSLLLVPLIAFLVVRRRQEEQSSLFAADLLVDGIKLLFTYVLLGFVFLFVLFVMFLLFGLIIRALFDGIPADNFNPWTLFTSSLGALVAGLGMLFVLVIFSWTVQYIWGRTHLMGAVVIDKRWGTGGLSRAQKVATSDGMRRFFLLIALGFINTGVMLLVLAVPMALTYLSLQIGVTYPGMGGELLTVLLYLPWVFVLLLGQLLSANYYLLASRHTGFPEVKSSASTTLSPPSENSVGQSNAKSISKSLWGAS